MNQHYPSRHLLEIIAVILFVVVIVSCSDEPNYTKGTEAQDITEIETVERTLEKKMFTKDLPFIDKESGSTITLRAAS